MTHALIAVETKAHTYKYIYLHADGYPEHAGVVLLNHYNTPKLVEDLISLGDISCLGEKIGVQIDFEKSITDSVYHNTYKDQCRAYHRDRGEALHIGACRTPKSFDFAADQYCYVYLYDMNTNLWYFYSTTDTWHNRRILLREAIDLSKANMLFHDYKSDYSWTDEELKEIWLNLSDVPFTENDKLDVENWFGFKRGADKYEDIWKWFDNKLSMGLGKFMESFEEDPKEGTSMFGFVNNNPGSEYIFWEG